MSFPPNAPKTKYPVFNLKFKRVPGIFRPTETDQGICHLVLYCKTYLAVIKIETIQTPAATTHMALGIPLN